MSSRQKVLPFTGRKCQAENFGLFLSVCRVLCPQRRAQRSRRSFQPQIYTDENRLSGVRNATSLRKGRRSAPNSRPGLLVLSPFTSISQILAGFLSPAGRIRRGEL